MQEIGPKGLFGEENQDRSLDNRKIEERLLEKGGERFERVNLVVADVSSLSSRRVGCQSSEIRRNRREIGISFVGFQLRLSLPQPNNDVRCMDYRLNSIV